MRRFSLLGLLLVCACEGSIVGTPGPSPTDPTNPDNPAGKSCKVRGQGSAPKMRLLWRAAYLTELSTHLGAGAATAADSVGLSPATDKQFPFDTAGSLLTDATVESLAATADAVAQYTLSTDAIATQVYGCNARQLTGTDAENCFAAFLRTTGSRLLRRPLSDAEIDDTLAFFRAQALLGESDGTREGFRQGLASLLLHPDFLFIRDVPATDTKQLEAFSLASRLSFALTGHGPDAALFTAAASGSLLNAQVLDAEVTRLLATPEAKLRSRAFFRQWLKYDGWSVAYSDAFRDGLDVSTVREEAVAELDGFVDRLTWDVRGDAKSLLTSRDTLPLTPTLAKIYGPPEGATELPANRAGLLTRVGLLASGTDDWHVVARGLTVLQKVLCRDIPPPTINTADAAKQAEALKVSNVERIKAITSQQACAGCHSNINPSGAARADFDGLGRHVTVEKHFAGGVFEYEVPVVASADLSAVLKKPVQVNGSVELSQALAASDDFQQCFTTQYVRSALGRADLSDECLSFDATAKLDEGGSMLDAIRAVVRSPDFLLWKE